MAAIRGPSSPKHVMPSDATMLPWSLMLPKPSVGRRLQQATSSCRRGFQSSPTKVARGPAGSQPQVSRKPPHFSTMTAVATTNNGGGGGAPPKASPSGSSGAQFKAMSVEEAQAILSSIASKIHGTSSATATTGTSAGGKSGGNDDAEEVTGADLASLRAVAFGSEEGKKAVPVLDREYLRTGASSSSSSSSIVRFFGFVQDQMDPEYYQTKVQGRNTKYRDYVYNGDDEQGGADFDPMMMGGDMELAERQPLVVVPLPFTSEWFREGLSTANNLGDEKMDLEKGSDANANTNANNNKRSREEEEIHEPAVSSENMRIEAPGNSVTEEEDSASPARNRAKNDAKSPNCVGSTPNALDWWPAGTMGSDESQIPVLAKVYYDDDEAEGDRLRLNDLVEMVGVVHFDPMEADFGSQQKKQQDSKDDTSGNGGCRGMFADELDGFDDLSLMDRCALPPPSLLPRLHVLCYNRVDLDKVARKVTLVADTGMSTSPEDADDRTFAIDALAHHLFAGKREAGEALLMALMSMAERETSANSSPGRPMTTPDGTTLGCASLNITLPTASACQSLKARLDATLRQILPVVASADLSLRALAGGGSPSASAASMSISSPVKTSEGRLAPSLMQLPKGAALLINQGSLGEGRVDEHGHRTLVALSGLTKNHTVSYRFDGMMDYQFEGDYRVIVVSQGSSKSSQNANTRGEKLLGCTMQFKLSSPEYEADSDHVLPAETAARVRSYIAHCRAYGSENNEAGNIALTRAILSQAEKDFVDRRVANRSDNSSNSNTKEIGEEDFHRWLNVTRLQARSRGLESAAGAEASLGDWEAALTLDDKTKAL